MRDIVSDEQRSQRRRGPAKCLNNLFPGPASSLSRDRIMLTLKLADGSRIIRIHKLNGELVSELTLKEGE